MVDGKTPAVPERPEHSEKPGPVIKKLGAVAIGAAPGKLLSPAAKRALAEADVRRKARNISDSKRPDEHSGPKGVEPTRFGDWERGGIAYDF
ncbi:MAG: DUF1674 domain-containing protein [Robiginitomaculum sp.]